MGHVIYFRNFGTPQYLGNGLNQKLQACRLTNRALAKKCKIGLKGVGKALRDLLFKFWELLHISRTVCVRNFKVGVQIDHIGH